MSEENEGITIWSVEAELERQWLKESWGKWRKSKVDNQRQATDQPHTLYAQGLDSHRYFCLLLLT